LPAASYEAYRQPELQLTSARFGHVAAEHPSAQHVQLGLAHGALETEKQPVVEVRRIVDTVLVQDQGAAQGTNLEQAVPIAGVARQAGDLQAHDDARAARADLADQSLKALAVFGRSAGLAEVAVDDHDALLGPAEHYSTLPKLVLPSRAFGVFEHLMQRRLADVEVGVLAQMLGRDLVVAFAWTHADTPSRAAAMAISAKTLTISGHACGSCAGPLGSGGVGRGATQLAHARIQATTP